MQFRELTDRQWKLIRSSLPRTAYTGRPRADDRMTINGILYILMSGCSGWICPPNTAFTKQCGSDIKNGVREAFERVMDSLVSHGYHI
jgi:hypothetical protein